VLSIDLIRCAETITLFSSCTATLRMPEKALPCLRHVTGFNVHPLFDRSVLVDEILNQPYAPVPITASHDERSPTVPENILKLTVAGVPTC
jgi:hypothetical protein